MKRERGSGWCGKRLALTECACREDWLFGCLCMWASSEEKQALGGLTCLHPDWYGAACTDSRGCPLPRASIGPESRCKRLDRKPKAGAA